MMKRIIAFVLVLLLCCMPAALAAKYERIVESDMGPYQWGMKDGYWYFCNEAGQAFSGYRWTDEDFNWLSADIYYKELPDGLIALCFGSVAKGKWGIIDTAGNIVVKPQYGWISYFANGNLLATRDEKYGVITTSGETVVDFRYDVIDYNDGFSLYPFQLNGKWGFMDDDGNHVIEAQFDHAIGMTNWAAVQVGDLWGMIAPDGSWIFEPQFDEYHSISAEYALVTRDGKYGAAKPDGTMLLDTVYDDLWGFDSDGISVACLDGKYGYMGMDGQWVIAPQYEYASAFGIEGYGAPGYAIVKVGGKYGIIDKSGEYFIEPVWEDIHRSADCNVSIFETWEYTEEAYHAVNGDQAYYFDIVDGAAPAVAAD